MALPHVTMRDVARSAGVHQTTVSMALRNDPRLPEKTRTHIKQIADRLGYHPDPILSALNFYRTARHPIKAPPTIAFILNLNDAKELNSSKASVYAHQRFYLGAQKKANQLGYTIECFYVKETADTKRLERILRTRGIVGVIICAISDRAIKFDWDWSAFCVTLIESQDLGLSFHSISSNHLRIARDAVKNLIMRGYRRIGLAVGRDEERYLQKAFTIGYYGELASIGETVHIPLFPLPNGLPENEFSAPLASWVRRNKVDVVLSNWPNVREVLLLRGVRAPRDVALVTMDLHPDQGPNVGMQQNHIIVGERAVEQLSIILRSNQRGFISHSNRTLIHGSWVDGTDLTSKLVAQAKRKPSVKKRRVKPSAGRVRHVRT